MKFVVAHSGLTSTALIGNWRIPSREVADFRSAQALLAFADERAAALGEHCRRELIEAQERGYEVGLARGRQEVARETAEALAALAQENSRRWRDLHQAISQLALEVVRRVAGEIGHDALVEHIAVQTFSEVQAERPFAVRVPPGAQEGVKRRLTSMGGQIRVVSDPALADDECVFETEGGWIHAGFNLQLEALMAAFAAAGAQSGDEVWA
jgi:flagellar biosynthesis/type III secretory pathway protein FliH